jgi:hypothetical protein
MLYDVLHVIVNRLSLYLYNMFCWTTIFRKQNKVSCFISMHSLPSVTVPCYPCSKEPSVECDVQLGVRLPRNILREIVVPWQTERVNETQTGWWFQPP